MRRCIIGVDAQRFAKGRHRQPRERIEAGPAVRGIALVLWTLLLLSLIAAGFLAVIRTEVRVARNALEGARAEALADAGVYRGIQALLAADTGIEFGAEVEQVLEGRPALRPAPRGASRGGRVFTVRAEAVTDTGARFVREAVVSLRASAGQPFRTLAWRQGRR